MLESLTRLARTLEPPGDARRVLEACAGPRRRACSLAACGLASALAVSGCVPGVGLDPVGDDWSIGGSWLLNGEPPTAQSCGALGVAYVRVRFYDGERTADHPRLVFPCAQGTFDTRPEQVVRVGTWTLALVAIDAEGRAIATAPPQVFEPVDVTGHIEVSAVDFVGP
jgi:hypothetical protein